MKPFFIILFLAFSARAENLPDIDAHQFGATPIEKSESGRVYLFQTAVKDLPKTGNLVMLEEQKKPIMAFRVLKTDPERGQFIAKRVRRYDQVGSLKFNQEYTSVEKISDIVPSPEALAAGAPTTTDELPPSPESSVTPGAGVAAPSATQDTTASLAPPAEHDQELDEAPAENKGKRLEVNDFDDELDSSTSPVNQKKKLDEEFTDEEENSNAKSAFEIDEAHRLNPFHNMITVQIGNYKNMSNFSLGNGESQSGMGVFFSRAFAQDVFVMQRAPQDALSLEFGFEYYRRINYDQQNDSYTLVPLVGALRYDLHFSNSLTAFGLFGFQYNWVSGAINSSQTTLSKIQGPQPDLGLGVLFNIGPQWYVRLDLGLDRMAAGLCVKW